MRHSPSFARPPGSSSGWVPGSCIDSSRAADAQEWPTLTVEAQYPGMPASVVEERVAATLEMKINGVANVERFRSRCGRDGSYSLEIAFRRGTDPNRAQMLVQNRVNDAMPLLPEEVRRLGVTVKKASPVLVRLLTLSSTGRKCRHLSISITTPRSSSGPSWSSLPGVAEVSVHGGGGMAARILLDPQKLAAHKLTVPDVKRAIEQQALEATSGPRGGFQFTPDRSGRPDRSGSARLDRDQVRSERQRNPHRGREVHHTMR